METPLRCKFRNSSSDSDCPRKDDIGTQSFVAPETPFLKRLGYGTGIGVYHLDRTLQTGRSPKSPWALKKVLRTHKNEDYGDRLQFEATLLRSLHHPNIIGFRGFSFTDDGREVLAMEECTISLGDLIEERFTQNSKVIFTADQISKVCFCVASALDYLHNEVKLMHGDIKSHNILVNGEFKDIKVCDFGVSIKVDEDGRALGGYVGTPSWSAPEALMDESVTTKADIFSLGLVIYEMIALHPPHLDDSLLEDDDSEISYCEYDYQDNYGKRPKLPEMEFKEEYNKILEIFNLCTEQEPEKRPSVKEIISKLGMQLGD